MKKPSVEMSNESETGFPGMPRGSWLPVGLLLIILLSGLPRGYPLTASAQEGSTITEYQLRAVFLYNFLKFVEWSNEDHPDSNLPIRITIFGKNPFGNAFDQIEGKTIKGRKLVIEWETSIEVLKPSHLIYINESDWDSTRDIIAALGYTGILTVGETERFTRLGGIIGFIAEDNRINFVINLDAANRAGLKLSPKLLRLAKAVYHVE